MALVFNVKELKEYKTEDFIELQKYYDTLTIEQLIELEEKVINEIETINVKLDDETVETLIEFIESDEKNYSYGVNDWKFVSLIVDLLRTKKEIGRTGIDSLASFINRATFKSIKGCDLGRRTLEAMKPLTVNVFNRQTQLQMLNDFISRKQQEIDTNLKFAKDDLDNQNKMIEKSMDSGLKDSNLGNSIKLEKEMKS